LAEADAMNGSLGLARREALWALKALRDEPLELFAAVAQREARTIEEVREPAVSLRPMTSGGEVVEDYRHIGSRCASIRRASCERILQAAASSPAPTR
jgi:error-prone DNA polymerase